MTIVWPFSCKDWGYWKFHKEAREEILLNCLQKGANPNSKDKNSQFSTPLLHAVKYGKSVTLISALLEAGANPNIQDETKWSPLLEAVYTQKWHAAKVLLNGGADPNITDEKNQSPLLWATNKRAPDDIILALMTAGAKLEDNGQGFSPLIDAAATKNWRLLKKFVDAGADPNPLDAKNWTPLMWALNKQAPPDVVKTLVDAGADPNMRDDKGRSALLLAVNQKASIVVIRTLVEAGADLEIPDEKGRTSLHWAANMYKEVDVAMYLVAAGAKTTVRDKRGRVAAEYLKGCKKFRDGSASFGAAKASVLTNCLALGFDPNADRGTNYPTMHMAVYAAKDSQILKALLNAGGDANLQNQKDTTPLHLAAAHGRSEMVKMLLGARANPKASNKTGWTPLHAGASLDASNRANSRNSDSLLIVKLLLAAGADPNAKNNKGWTPLHVAVRNFPNTNLANKLLAAGADPTVKNDQGKVPFEISSIRRDSPAYWTLKAASAGGCSGSKGWNTQDFFISVSVNVVKSCLKYGSDPNARDAAGATPLDFAMRQGNETLVAALKEAGATEFTQSIQNSAQSIHSPQSTEATVADTHEKRDEFVSALKSKFGETSSLLGASETVFWAGVEHFVVAALEHSHTQVGRAFTTLLTDPGKASDAIANGFASDFRTPAGASGTLLVAALDTMVDAAANYAHDETLRNGTALQALIARQTIRYLGASVNASFVAAKAGGTAAVSFLIVDQLEYAIEDAFDAYSVYSELKILKDNLALQNAFLEISLAQRIEFGGKSAGVEPNHLRFLNSARAVLQKRFGTDDGQTLFLISLATQMARLTARNGELEAARELLLNAHEITDQLRDKNKILAKDILLSGFRIVEKTRPAGHAEMISGYCNLMSGNLSEVCALMRFTGGHAPQ